VLLYCVRQETFQKCDLIVKAVYNSTYGLETGTQERKCVIESDGICRLIMCPFS
jgi:hypothetical protein